MNHIKLTNISKIYSINDQPFYAVNNISLQINTTQNTIIIGKSGCGKSTLLNMINGLTSISEGEILFPKNFKTATVFQESRLLPWLTIEQNATFWAPHTDPTSLLKELELFDFKKLYPHEISGGMAQKTALIRALLYEADFLLLDEPFASLDYFTRLYMQKKLIDLTSKQKLGMIFITHNVDKAVLLGDTIIILEKGAIKTILVNKLPLTERVNSVASNEFKNEIISIINE